MEHAKKMMLVDPRLYRPTIQDKTLSSLDSQIGQTLNNDMSDDLKVKRYLEALNKYRAYEAPKTIEATQDFESRVVDSVPISQQYKARRLMDYLKRDPDIKLSDKGQLIYRQSLMPNSNIVDIMSDILKKNTVGENPFGWEQVLNSLSNQNVPQELVTNARKWRFIRETKNAPTTPTSTVRVQDSTPRTSTRGRKIPKRLSPSATFSTIRKKKLKKIDWEQY